jgi:hypothetical protein
MKTLTVNLILAIAFVGFAGCSKTHPAESNPLVSNCVVSIPDGAYQYKAYDSTGALVVQGWFGLIMHDSTQVSGEWHFTKIDSASNIGPHFGDGNLVGDFTHKILSLNLNPDYIDNNVFLQGSIAGDTISGKWFWDGFPGVLNQGNFLAIKSFKE